MTDRKEYVKKWVDAHREQINARNRKWKADHIEQERTASKDRARKRYKENPEKTLAASRKWRIANPDKVKAQNEKFRAEHPDKRREYERKRRSIKSNTVLTLTLEEEAEILRAGCFFCGSHDDLTIAHDVPVSKGGHTTRANLFCACRSCNSKMHTRTLAQTIKQLLLGG